MNRRLRRFSSLRASTLALTAALALTGMASPVAAAPSAGHGSGTVTFDRFGFTYLLSNPDRVPYCQDVGNHYSGTFSNNVTVSNLSWRSWSNPVAAYSDPNCRFPTSPTITAGTVTINGASCSVSGLVNYPGGTAGTARAGTEVVALLKLSGTGCPASQMVLVMSFTGTIIDNPTSGCTTSCSTKPDSNVYS